MPQDPGFGSILLDAAKRTGQDIVRTPGVYASLSTNSAYPPPDPVVPGVDYAQHLLANQGDANALASTLGMKFNNPLPMQSGLASVKRP